MTFWIQHGYGKGDKLEQLVALQAVDGVILSPAHETPAAMTETIAFLKGAHVPVVLDTQTYVHSIPGSVSGKHDQFGLDFPSIVAGADPRDMEIQVAKALAVNAELDVDGPFYSPTVLQPGFEDAWAALALQYARVGIRQGRAAGRGVFVSFVFGEDAIAGAWNRMARWLDIATGLDASGIYMIIEKSGDYPAPWRVDRLTNVMRLIYRLSVLNDFNVIVGYTDIDGLAAIAAGATGIASGWHFGQRQFKAANWMPDRWGRARSRLTSSEILSPLRFEGEADDIVRSAAYATRVFPDALLCRRLASPGAIWAVPSAAVQHLQTVSQLARGLSALPPRERPAQLLSQIGQARQLLRELRQDGFQLPASYDGSLAALAGAITEFVRVEGL